MAIHPVFIVCCYNFLEELRSALCFFQIDKEFLRTSTVPLLSTFFAALDQYSSRLMEMFKHRGGAAGRRFRQVMDISKVCLLVCVSVCVSVLLSVSLLVCPSVGLCLFVCLSLSASLPACLSFTVCISEIHILCTHWYNNHVQIFQLTVSLYSCFCYRMQNIMSAWIILFPLGRHITYKSMYPQIRVHLLERRP